MRPTPARVRETVFNWLAGNIEGAQCADLYAGSGALGFEAASRGAQRVTLVDRDRTVVQCLRQETRKFSAAQIEIVHARALAYIDCLRDPLDILFVDPPFASGTELLEKTCVRLAATRALKDSSLVYVESPANWAVRVPATWTALKSRQAGQVGYHLFAARPYHSSGSRQAGPNGTTATGTRRAGGGAAVGADCRASWTALGVRRKRRRGIADFWPGSTTWRATATLPSKTRRAARPAATEPPGQAIATEIVHFPHKFYNGRLRPARP